MRRFLACIEPLLRLKDRKYPIIEDHFNQSTMGNLDVASCYRSSVTAVSPVVESVVQSGLYSTVEWCTVTGLLSR